MQQEKQIRDIVPPIDYVGGRLQVSRNLMGHRVYSVPIKVGG